MEVGKLQEASPFRAARPLGVSQQLQLGNVQSVVMRVVPRCQARVLGPAEQRTKFPRRVPDKSRPRDVDSVPRDRPSRILPVDRELTKILAI